MSNPIKDIVRAQKLGVTKGITSICTANAYVLEAAMESALQNFDNVLIEATANQVNQFGGYMGMTPVDFREYVYKIADKVNFPKDKIILGGDHLGPLTWKHEDESVAMEKAIDLIKAYVLAGFSKIHIDTSMKLGNDGIEEPLIDAVIARRSAVLCRAAEEAYQVFKQIDENAKQPVYVIGSEVPIPGGSQDEEEEGIGVTKVKDFRNTVDTFKKVYLAYGLESAWENVVAVVVQPGVEFGDEIVHEYNRDAAKALTDALNEYPSLVFEGHSTDYQTPTKLREMVEDGIAILKVGPAVTFQMREAVFLLSQIEKELFEGNEEIILSDFREVLEEEMLSNIDNWKQHYHSEGHKLKLARKYSYLDRSRYYFQLPRVQTAFHCLLKNLETITIPITLISQYFPKQYIKICDGRLENKPEELIKDHIKALIEQYHFAVNS